VSARAQRYETAHSALSYAAPACLYQNAIFSYFRSPWVDGRPVVVRARNLAFGRSPDGGFANRQALVRLVELPALDAGVGMARALEFGLNSFGEVTEDSSGRPLAHAQIIRNVIEEAVLAEDVGVDVYGIGEHHRHDFAISSPEIVLAAICGRTQRIRLCSATTVLSTDDPVRVFERFSTLNAIAKGRAEVILGRGWFTEPFRLFGYELSEYDSLFEEKLGLFALLIRQTTVSWRGKSRPPLVDQAIFPPIESGTLRAWIAVGSTPESVLRAARFDMPMIIAVIGGEPKRFLPLAEMYRIACEKLGRPPNGVGVHSNGYVANNDDQARDEFWAHYSLARNRLGAERGWSPIDRPKFDLVVDRGSLFVGSPGTVARKIATTIRELSACRFDLKYSQGTLPHDKLMQSIELYGRKVVPMVRDMLA
jgi:probable LLM family oxidoreductase